MEYLLGLAFTAIFFGLLGAVLANSRGLKGRVFLHFFYGVILGPIRYADHNRHS